ncbi:unannotated protein [freshwater metagenome]|uniref:Unannotated protein n=1 Tax=freshwater metagenome TaxID=449393 RepID=A0A6J7E8E7_9ZZZZ
MDRDRYVVPLSGHKIVAQTCFRREPDGVEHPVDTIPNGGDVVAHPGEMLGGGDIQLENRRRLRKLAGSALGQAEAPTRPREHHVGALFLRDPCHAEGERCIREDAGDHDVLAVEQTHGTSP